MSANAGEHGRALTEAILRARVAVRPLLFKSDIPEAPYWLGGTGFLVGYRRSVFVVTAAHVVAGQPSTAVHVQPTDRSAAPYVLTNGFKVEPEDPAQESDVIVYQAATHAVPRSERDVARLFPLDVAGATDWMRSSYVADFFICGYPLELNELDYEKGVVKSAQAILLGRYAGAAEAHVALHRLQVLNPDQIGHFRGFSGSPVLSIEHRLASTPVLRFCGIAVWGTVESGIVHFLEADRIVSTIETALESMSRGIGGPAFAWEPGH